VDTDISVYGTMTVTVYVTVSLKCNYKNTHN